MDVLGAGTAVLVVATRIDDLVGFRTSHLDAYEHDVSTRNGTDPTPGTSRVSEVYTGSCHWDPS
jgi:hypothetical protein